MKRFNGAIAAVVLLLGVFSVAPAGPVFALQPRGLPSRAACIHGFTPNPMTYNDSEVHVKFTCTKLWEEPACNMQPMYALATENVSNLIGDPSNMRFTYRCVKQKAGGLGRTPVLNCGIMSGFTAGAPDQDLYSYVCVSEAISCPAGLFLEIVGAPKLYGDVFKYSCFRNG